MNDSTIPAWASFSTAARWLSLTASTFTAVLTLWSPTSLASRVSENSDFIVWSSTFTLALCALGWADVFWHDLRGRLILPSIDMNFRHKVCVLLYMLLAFSFLQRAFVSAENFALLVPLYYIMAGVGIGLTALAVAVEERVCTGQPP
jgi:hypothetical protein